MAVTPNRYVEMQASRQRHNVEPEMETDDIIDKSAYMAGAAPVAAAAPPAQHPTLKASNWSPGELRTVPAFYPLEKSSRLVEDDTAAAIAYRVSECLRHLSIQATYDNDTACLYSAENVEMHLSLWKTPPTSPQQGIVIELQRRAGDSIAFHKYSRSILDAAMGLMEIESMQVDEDIIYSKKVQRLLALEKNVEKEEHETAVQAIEIAHGLLMKDRMDARVLGLESLCLLTDPRKTGPLTSILAAHVVLLGSTQGVQIPGVEEDAFADEAPFQEIHEGILQLVQFGRIGEEDEDLTESSDADLDHMMLLHNLALAVLANSLDCVENPDRFSVTPEDTKPRARLRTSSSAEVANEFMQQTEELSKKEILSTLISELGKASQKPHNATLSAKCIGSLCRASDEAKKRAKELGAKQVVSTAMDVGVRTHLKLETECRTVVTVLERTASQEEEQQQQQQQVEVVQEEEEGQQEEEEEQQKQQKP